MRRKKVRRSEKRTKSMDNPQHHDVLPIFQGLLENFFTLRQSVSLMGNARLIPQETLMLREISASQEVGGGIDLMKL